MSTLPDTPLHPDRFPTLNLTRRGDVARIDLDHGRANEMGSAQLTEWERLAGDLEAGDVRALVTTSARVSRRGTPIFISGADVTERAGWSKDRIKAHVRWQRALLRRLRHAPVFHVAVVHGVALGWGTEFLLTCDYRIATPTASFALPETGIGILPGAGGTSELWSLVGVPTALRLGMTGARISAEEALRVGLVDEIAPDLDAGCGRAMALSEQVARRSPTAVAAFKRGVLASVGQPADARADIEARAYEACVDAGEAAIGRENFKAITKGEEVTWGDRVDYEP
jgi:enoyl-CoA hydratase/carnithine racemase